MNLCMIYTLFYLVQEVLFAGTDVSKSVMLLMQEDGGNYAVFTLVIKWIPILPTFLHIHEVYRYTHALHMRRAWFTCSTSELHFIPTKARDPCMRSTKDDLVFKHI